MPQILADKEAASAANNNAAEINLEHFCASVFHTTMGETISKYQIMAKDPETRELWKTAFGKEWGNIAKGDTKTVTEGTDSVFVMKNE